MVRLHTGDAFGAREVESEAVDIFRHIKNPIGEAIGLLHLGQIDAYVGNRLDAQKYLEQCLSIASDLEYHEVESECELVLGQLALQRADPANARERFVRSLDVSQKAADKRNEASALWWLGKIDLLAGDLAAAKMKFGAALRVFSASEMFSEMLGCLEDHAALLKVVGRGEDGATLCGATDAMRERLALPRAPFQEAAWKELVRDLRSATASNFDHAWKRGTALELRDAVSFAQARRLEELQAA
jgi:tetratricopeptide (TPR) repeat protein